jgi:hypothetical protein
MALMRDRKKFEEHRQRKLEESEKSGQSSNFNNPNQVKFEAGKTYRFRLLFDESDKRINPKTGDHDPFVSKWTHGGKNSEGKWRSILIMIVLFVVTAVSFIKAGKKVAQKEMVSYTICISVNLMDLHWLM